jgi:hypothetical protein
VFLSTKVAARTRFGQSVAATMKILWNVLPPSSLRSAAPTA